MLPSDALILNRILSKLLDGAIYGFYGCLPMIILFFKRRIGIGIGAPLVCCIFGMWNVYAFCLFFGIYLLIAIFIQSNRTHYPSQATEKKQQDTVPTPVLHRPEAPLPTNPGTDKIPAWKRVQLEQQAAAKEASAASDPVVQNEGSE